MLSPEQLLNLEAVGWRLTRDGSTATARFNWDDPEDPDVGWELLVLHTAGHPNRFSLDTEGFSERGPGELERVKDALAAAELLLHHWTGELPDESEA